jgi:Lon protease-like protein
MAIFELPLFTLHTVLFPGAPIYLHIFEKRYREMLARCMENDHRFGVVLIRQGAEVSGGATPHSVGCVARIIHIEPLPDDHMNVVAIGEQRFVIQRLLTDRSYLCGEVELLTLENQPAEEMTHAVQTLSRQVTHYLEMINQAKTGNIDLERLHLPEDPLALIYLSASFLQLPPDEKQPLLALQNVPELMDCTQRLYRREMAVNQRMLNVSESEAVRIAQLN